MIRALQFLLVLLAAVVCAVFASSCNLMEALHQTSPNYRNPVPFSEPWWDAIKSRQKKREIRRIEEDWGVAKRERILEKKRLWEESIYGRE
jgi:hypothetical protein